MIIEKQHKPFNFMECYQTDTEKEKVFNNYCLNNENKTSFKHIEKNIKTIEELKQLNQDIKSLRVVGCGCDCLINGTESDVLTCGKIYNYGESLKVFYCDECKKKSEELSK